MEMEYAIGECVIEGQYGLFMFVTATNGKLPNGHTHFAIPIESEEDDYIDQVTKEVGASVFMAEWFSNELYVKGRHKV